MTRLPETTAPTTTASPRSPQFYDDWFARCETLEALKEAWGVFCRLDRKQMTGFDQKAVEKAKDARKAQLQPRRVA